nr:sarcosine oxidase subunit gamma family protein [Pseudonocardia sp. C8]
MAKVTVRAPFGGATDTALGTGFGRTARIDTPTGTVLVVGSGPGEWLVLGAPGTGDALRDHLEETLASSGEFVTVLDLTHGRALVRIRGRSAAAMLAKVCGIDLSEQVTPDGAALRTSVAKVVTDVVRDDRGGEVSYLLHCERSSGRYLCEALLDAGAEFGIEVTGFDAMTVRQEVAR